MAAIGFIGLGNMGGPMAKNLVKAGHELKVFDLAPASVAALVEAGAKKAASAKEAASEADFVVTMLPANAVPKRVKRLSSPGVVKPLTTKNVPMTSASSRTVPMSAKRLLCLKGRGFFRGASSWLIHRF